MKLTVYTAGQAGRPAPGYCPACLWLWADKTKPKLPHEACRKKLQEREQVKGP